MAKVTKAKAKAFSQKYWKDALYITGLIVLSFFTFKNCSGNSEQQNATQQEHKYNLINCPLDTVVVTRTETDSVLTHDIYFKEQCPEYKDTVLYNIIKKDTVIYKTKYKTKYKEKIVYVPDTVKESARDTVPNVRRDTVPSVQRDTVAKSSKRRVIMGYVCTRGRGECR